MVTKTQHFDTASEHDVVHRYKRSTNKQSGVKLIGDFPGIQHATGNLAVQRMLRSDGIQAKLTVNQPGDEYEQEADHVAEQVMRMPSPDSVQRGDFLSYPDPIRIQRLSPQTKEVRRQPEEEEEEEESVQAKESPSHTPIVTPDLHTRIHSLRGSGQPLPKPTRAFMESRFGYDFKHVRVHTDSDAVYISQRLHAQAFTHGQDIYFGPGTAPNKNALTAHELTNVIQQTGASSTKESQQGQHMERARGEGCEQSIAAEGVSAGIGRKTEQVPSVQRVIELRPPGRREASAFGRAQELIDRLNAQSASIRYRLDGRVLR